MDKSRKNRNWVFAGILALVAAAAITIWATWSPKPTPPTADVAALAKFVRTSQFNKLPEAEKRPYMKALREGMSQLVEARNQGRISQNDYEAAYLNAYLERKLDDMEEFFQLPEAKRKQVLLAEYVNKQRAKPATVSASTATPPQPDEQKEEDFVDDRVETWPPEERAKWEEYRKAVKEAKLAAKGAR
jgi:hypothetical protein